MKKTILLFSMLVPFFVFSQNITNITPNQAMQCQTIPLIISGNNMSFSGWSCWSNTGNLSDFRFSQWYGTNMLYGTSISATATQLNGSLSVSAFQPIGIYNLEVFDCLTSWWIQFPNSFQINAAAAASWNCMNGACIDPGTGNGTYASLSACQANCIVVTPTWDCEPSTGICSDPGTGNGTYASLSACQAACVVVTPTWDCISPGNCQDPGTGNGTYASLSACQANCNNVSVEEIGLTNFKIFPNPSSDLFNISFSSNRVQDLRIRILNSISEEVMIIELNQYKGEYTKQINLTNNAKGIYFLEIKTNDGVINKKLILQ